MILKREPVTTMGPVTSRTPDVAVVYVTADGTIDVYDRNRRDRWSRRVFAGYKWRYEVDMGDHRRTVELRTSPLPARGDAFHFDTMFDVGFRVVDAVAVVERDIDDGLAVVYNHLINVCRPITRTYEIGNAIGAENKVNAHFLHGETLDEGILIYRCHSRLSSTSHIEFEREQAAARNANIIKATQHEMAVDDQRRANQLAKIKQDGEFVLRSAERADIGAAELSPSELIRMHLARFPSDTATAMKLMQELEQSRWQRREVQDQRANELFRFLADRNLVHAVDMTSFREQVVGQLSGPPHGEPAAIGMPAARAPKEIPADMWSAPVPSQQADRLPELPHDVPAGTAEPTSQQALPGGVVAVRGATDDVVPVYVLIDRSVAVDGYIDQLNAGIDALLSALIKNRDVATIIRLAIIGYAEDASLRLDLTPVDDGTHRLVLTTGGEARYSVAFEQLLNCIPRDVETLKGQRSMVRRPQVLFLTGGSPADEASWGPVYQRLVDRHEMRYAPDVIAFGFGNTTPATLFRIATAHELAFIAIDGPPERAIQEFFSFAVRQMIGYGRAALQGYAGPVVTVPPGFRAADPT